MIAFEHFLVAASVDSSKEKKAWMMLVGGGNLQNVDTFLTKLYQQHNNSEKSADQKPIIDVYEECKNRLNRYFYEKIRIAKFKSIKQEPDESFNDFVMRLQSHLNPCNFARPCDEMKLQISISAKEPMVRTKAQEPDVQLEELVSYGRNMEMIGKSLKMIRECAEMEQEGKVVEQQTARPARDESESDSDYRSRHHKRKRKHSKHSRDGRSYKHKSRKHRHRSRSSRSRSRSRERSYDRYQQYSENRHFTGREPTMRFDCGIEQGAECGHCGKLNQIDEFCFHQRQRYDGWN